MNNSIITVPTNDKELQEVIEGTIQWHKNLMTHFEMLIEHADKEMVLNDSTITLNPEQIKPFRLGLRIMMALSSNFPLKIEGSDGDDDE